MSLAKKQDFVMGGVTFKYDPKSKGMWVKIGKERGYVQRKDLWMMVFMTTKEKKLQDDLIIEQEKEMMTFVRQHQVKATKDIKEGEMMTVNCNVNVPLVVVESLLKAEGVTDTKSVMLPSSEKETVIQ